MDFDRYYDYCSQALVEWASFKSQRPQELENIENGMKGIYWIFQYADRSLMLWEIHSHPSLREDLQLLPPLYVNVFRGRGRKEKYDIPDFVWTSWPGSCKLFFLQYVITKIVGTTKTRFHESALLYDQRKGIVYHFEPLGDLPWLCSLEKILAGKLSPFYRFEPSYQICPQLGPQAVIDKGYCAAFSTYFFWRKINDLNRPLTDIISDLLDLPDDILQSEIENFICFGFLLIYKHKLYLLEIYYEKIREYLETRRDYERQIKLIDQLYEELNFPALEELSQRSTEILELIRNKMDR